MIDYAELDEAALRERILDEERRARGTLLAKLTDERRTGYPAAPGTYDGGPDTPEACRRRREALA